MRRTIRLFSALAALLVGLGAVVIALLSRHPLHLDFLLPRVEALINADPSAATVQLGGLVFVWDSERHRPEFRALDVNIAAGNNGARLRVPAVALHPRLRALLRGRLEVGSVDIIEPQLQIVHHASGSFDLRAADSQAASLGDEGQRQQWLSLILDQPNQLPAAARLDRLHVHDATVEIRDQDSGRSLQLVGLDFTAERTREGLSGDMQFAVGQQPHPTQVRAIMSYHSGADLIALNVDTKDVSLPTLASSSPWSQALQVPLDIHAALAVNKSLQLLPLHADVHGAGGALILPGEQRPLAVQMLNLSLSFDPQTGRLEVPSAALTFDGVALEGRGTIDTTSAGHNLKASLRSARIPAEAVKRDWPADVAPKARQWVAENIGDGSVHGVEIQLTGVLAQAGNAFAVENLSGRFSFDGLAVTFLDGVSPVREIEGDATLSTGALQFAVRRGRLRDLDITRASVTIAGMGTDATLAVDADIEGPLSTALNILDAPRFGAASAIGLRPTECTGSTSANVKLNFGLEKKPALGDLGLVVRASVRDAAVSKFAGVGVSNGNFDVAVDGTLLKLDGDLQAQHVPLHLTSTIAIDKPSSHQVEMQARLDRDALDALGLDVGEWLDGPLTAALRSAPADKEGDRWDLDVDLRDATISVLAPAASKPASLPGDARARLRVSGGELVAIDDFDITAGRTSVRGSAARGGIQRTWQIVDATATVDGPTAGDPPGQLTFALRPGDHETSLRISTDDAGRLSRALGFVEASGGRAALMGQIDLQSRGLPFSGRLTIDQFTVVRAPILARLLTLASLPGVLASLTGSGLSFDSLAANLSYQPPTLTIGDLLLNGKALVVKGGGKVQPSAGSIDAKGSLIPSYYGLNQAATRLPLIGKYVEKTAGDAIQSFDFKLSGSLRDPETKIETRSLVPLPLRDLLRKEE